MEYRIGTKVFTNWTIEKELGEGATGRVFEIQKTDYGITTRSALKVIRVPHSASDIRAALAEGMDEQSVSSYFKGFVDEIVKEIVIMTNLKSHPNIVSYEDHHVTEHEGTLGWDILIRMELLTPLYEYQLEHPMHEKDVLRMGVELIDALSFCQKKGIMHRDIKPENIFVSETGQFKLGDFGVARTVEKTTGGLSRKGTEKYMAPEVYLGKPYDQTVDLYSLGLVLYSFLNRGRLPFYPLDKNQISFADRENAMDRRMKGEAVPAPVDATGDLGKIIQKACAYNPADRYQTAADMFTDLENVTYGEEKQNGYYAAGCEEKTVSMEYTESEVKTVGMWDTEPEEKTMGMDYTQTDAKAGNTDTVQNDAEKKEVNGSTNRDAYITAHIEPSISPADVPDGNNETDDKEKKAEKKKKLKWGAFGIIVLLFIIIAVYLYHQAAYEEEKDSAFRTAANYIDNDQNEDAIGLLTELVDKYPEDHRGYEYLSYVYEELGRYEDALNILSDGMIYTEEDDDYSSYYDDFSSEYDRISQKKEYSEAISSAESNMETGDIEQAQADYEMAIGIDPDNELAYEGMTDLYISQGKYDEGMEWLDASKCEYSTKKELKIKCLLPKINKLMNDGDYQGLLNSFKTDGGILYTEDDYYYQDGQIVDNIENGKGLILSYRGVYSGDIVNGKREGSGKQFGTYSGEEKIYTLTEGMWSGNKANGKCTYTKTNLEDESDTWSITGNIKDNMFDGDLSYTKIRNDGQKDTFIGHADNGTFSPIRKEDGKYVVWESSSGWSYYYDTEEGLKNHGVWDGY